MPTQKIELFFADDYPEERAEQIKHCLAFFEDHIMDSEEDRDKIRKIITLEHKSSTIKVVEYNPADLDGYERPYKMLSIGGDTYYLTCCGWDDFISYDKFETSFYDRIDTITIHDIQKLVFFSLVDDYFKSRTVIEELKKYFKVNRCQKPGDKLT